MAQSGIGEVARGLEAHGVTHREESILPIVPATAPRPEPIPALSDLVDQRHPELGSERLLLWPCPIGGVSATPVMPQPDGTEGHPEHLERGVLEGSQSTVIVSTRVQFGRQRDGRLGSFHDGDGGHQVRSFPGEGVRESQLAASREHGAGADRSQPGSDTSGPPQRGLRSRNIASISAGCLEWSMLRAP